MAKGSRGGRRVGVRVGVGVSVNPIEEVSIFSLVMLDSIYGKGDSKELRAGLKTMGAFYRKYGVDIKDTQVALLPSKNDGIMGYYDGKKVSISAKYFNLDSMNKAYDESVLSKFHPSRNNKSGIEAVIAHEFGHQVTNEVGKKIGKGYGDMKNVASTIVKQAMANTKTNSFTTMASKISGYASYSGAEAIAEAFSDVYCNGKKASSASKAIVNVVDSYFK